MVMPHPKSYQTGLRTLTAFFLLPYDFPVTEKTFSNPVFRGKKYETPRWYQGY